jgi:hypothetical protein
MDRPTLTLAERVAAGSFVARRHRDLLDGPLLDGPPALRQLQLRFQRAGSGREKRRIGRLFAAVVSGSFPGRERPGVVQPSVSRLSSSVRLPLLSPKPAPESNDQEDPPESYREMLERVWGVRPPWRDRGVDPADGHLHSNVVPGRPLSSWPGSPVQGESRPPIGPPSEPS